MDVRRASTMFRIEGRVSTDELNTRFRELVKKYHPDKVRDHPEWAHERMSEINDAYEVLTEWLKKPPQKDPVHTPDENFEKERAPGSGPQPQPAPEDAVRPPAGTPIREWPPIPLRSADAFFQARESFLDALGTYYQYGLENPAYRMEGVRRFRFREVLRQLEKSKKSLAQFTGHHPVFDEMARFARLTSADIATAGSIPHDGNPRIRRLDSRFRTARKTLDAAVKDAFFPELVPGHLRGRALSALYSCYAEFALYLSIFDSGERHKAAVLATARWDTLVTLLEIRAEGLLDF